MKKAIITAALAITAITGLAASTATPSKDNNDLKSRIYYYVHYRSFYYTPVYYRPVYVPPVVYPVYAYHYWYYKFAGR